MGFDVVHDEAGHERRSGGEYADEGAVESGGSRNCGKEVSADKPFSLEVDADAEENDVIIMSDVGPSNREVAFKRRKKASKYLTYRLSHAEKMELNADEELVLQYVWSDAAGAEGEFFYEDGEDLIRLCRLQFKGTQGLGWFCGSILDAYAHLFNRQEANKGTFSRFCFTTFPALQSVWHLDGQQEAPPDFYNYTKSVLHRLPYINNTNLHHEKCHYYLFPAIFDDHFVVYCVNMVDRRFEFLSSKKPRGRRVFEVGDMVVRHITRYLETEHQVRFDAFDWNTPNVPVQQDGSNCGVFALVFMEDWVGRLIPATSTKDWTNPDVLSNMRGKIVARLLMHERNRLMEGLLKKALAWNEANYQV